MKRWRRIPIVILVVAALLVGLRVALPHLVLREMNARMQEMGEYRGHVQDIDLHLWRGAYSIRGMIIEKTSGKVPVPLLKAPLIELSVSWRALLDGAIVARVIYEDATLNLVDGATRADSQTGRGVDWRAQLERLVPVRIDELRIRRSVIAFHNFISNPPVDINATEVEATVTNLTNVRGASGQRVATLEAGARILGGAPVEVRASFDPLEDKREFALDFRVRSFELPAVNDLFRAYAQIDFESGGGDFVMQLEARDGRLSGYAKPLLRDIELIKWKEDRKNPVKLAWESLAVTVFTLFKNHQQDQFATRVEISGDIGQPDVSLWEAVGGVLRNAFVEALRPDFEKPRLD